MLDFGKSKYNQLRQDDLQNAAGFWVIFGSKKAKKSGNIATVKWSSGRKRQSFKVNLLSDHYKFFWDLFFILFGLNSCEESPKETCKIKELPNILWLTVEDINHYAFGCYGN